MTSGIQTIYHCRYHTSPLMCAARGGHSEVIGRLVQAGANLDKQDSRGYTVRAVPIIYITQTQTAVKVSYIPTDVCGQGRSLRGDWETGSGRGQSRQARLTRIHGKGCSNYLYNPDTDSSYGIICPHWCVQPVEVTARWLRNWYKQGPI